MHRVYVKFMLFTNLSLLEGQGYVGNFSKNKRTGGHHFAPPINPQHRYQDTWRNQCEHYLTILLAPWHPAPTFSASLPHLTCPTLQMISKVAPAPNIPCKQPWQEPLPLQSDSCPEKKGTQQFNWSSRG